MSIGKLSAGGQTYYLSTVAAGVEDYYIGRGEAPGWWAGSLAAELALDGRVDGESLRAVLEGRDPKCGVRLARTRSDRVPGFDLTFPGAEVSVDPVRPRGARGCPGGARRTRPRSRRGAWLSRNERVLVASRHQRHRASPRRRVRRRWVPAPHQPRRRPHLHTHVLVANLTQVEDGGWLSLDARHLYLHAKTAGYLYEVHLRAELATRLGVGWEPVRNGIADISGISDPVLRGFSTRRAEIEAEMTSRGTSSARAAEVAALETRQAKDYRVAPAWMTQRWWDQAHELGLQPDELESVLGRAEPAALDEEAIRATVGELLGPEGLTAQASTFDRRDVLRAWCARLPAGAEVPVIEALADRTLSGADVVTLDTGTFGVLRTRVDGRRIAGPDLGSRYSTSELIALEQRLVEQASARRDDAVGVVDEPTVLRALGARPELSEEQAAMVAQLTTSGHGVDVVIAPAGTGKTFALDAARDAWQHGGHQVIGAALAARAAAELEATAGIPSTTVASLLADLDDPEHSALPPDAVLVVDEAAMIGTRTLGRLLTHAERARAKVVLVGDPRQLPEIGAGGLLAGLGERLEPIRLTQNRRQHDPWERAALRALRAGDIGVALAAYDEHQRITTTATAPGARDAMVADWWAARLQDRQVLMVAARWSDVDDLNARARQRLDAAGLLTGPTLEIDGRPHQIGDRVMTLRNQRRLGVRNGTPATITHVDPTARAMTIRTDRGTSHTLPGEYLDAGHLRHAYATTIHKAQGLTVDQTLVLGNDTLYREAGYVALSRGRAQNRLYLVAQADELEQHAPPPEREPLDTIAGVLSISHAQRLAIDHHIDQRSLRNQIEDLHHELRELRTIERAAPRDPTADIAALTRSRATLGEDLQHRRDQLERLDQRRPLRHRREHTAERIVALRQVEQLTNQLHHTEDALALAIEQRDELDAFVSVHHDQLHRIPVVTADVGARVRQLVDAYRHDPPSYLQELGTCPTDPALRRTWTEAASAIENYRAEHHVTDPSEPVGPRRRHEFHQKDVLEKLDAALERIDPARAAERGGIELGL